jgi:hypothetical protein
MGSSEDSPKERDAHLSNGQISDVDLAISRPSKLRKTSSGADCGRGSRPGGRKEGCSKPLVHIQNCAGVCVQSNIW